MPNIISNTSCRILLDNNINGLDILGTLYQNIFLTEELKQQEHA